VTATAPLTPSSPDWGTIVCDFCQRAPVGRQGDVCWNCASYEEYLAAPRCPCDHDPNEDCACDSDCEEDCPAGEYAFGGRAMRRFDDGQDWGQPRAAPERSDGQG
jgi:hypothetical protein